MTTSREKWALKQRNPTYVSSRLDIPLISHRTDALIPSNKANRHPGSSCLCLYKVRTPTEEFLSKSRCRNQQGRQHLSQGVSLGCDDCLLILDPLYLLGTLVACSRAHIKGMDFCWYSTCFWIVFSMGERRAKWFCGRLSVPSHGESFRLPPFLGVCLR